MNHIGIQYWPMRLQPSDYCEITISCQVCWRMRRWHNGRTRRSPNPKSEIVLRDCPTNGEESAAHSILARSDSLQQRPYTFAQTNLVTSSLFRLRRRGGPYIPGCRRSGSYRVAARIVMPNTTTSTICSLYGQVVVASRG